ncbi:hypothetical protein J2R99_000418 [Rhodopseudomonas julia]|uniref:NIPSNAP domain-containing protein n=1 Tax=Rhodopseudomonas julia TaxID=200617 RepID=A0ABU0C234_9BRAD|nr:NIPSNAP family protein [Rhodopseudomonas julia]MDQ0324569.1 hypothetical protein [Rhodopseudomonas julia]
MLYELATLSCPVLGVTKAAEGARRWTGDEDALGTPLGMWRSDIGTIGELFVLRSFEAEEELRAERERALMSEDPFFSRETARTLRMESFAPFPFLPAIKPRQYGGLFEFRTYHLRPGGLPRTLAGWEAAIGPAAAYTDHLVTNLYALDGPARITHIWGFSSLEERARLRAEHYAAGLWPPKGGPEEIVEATSTIAKAEEGWPIG